MEKNDLRNLESTDEEGATRKTKKEKQEIVNSLNDEIKADAGFVGSDNPSKDTISMQEINIDTTAENEQLVDIAVHLDNIEMPETAAKKPARKPRAKKIKTDDVVAKSELPLNQENKIAVEPVLNNETSEVVVEKPARKPRTKKVVSEPEALEPELQTVLESETKTEIENIETAKIAEKPARKPRAKKITPEESVAETELPQELPAEPVAETEQPAVGEKPEVTSTVAEPAKKKLIKKIKTEEVTSEKPVTDEELHPEDAIIAMDETSALIKEIEQEQEKKPELSYETLSREELTIMLEEAVTDRDINEVRAEVAMIKVAFHQKEKEEKEALLMKFIEGGGVKEDFNYEPDAITERFNAAHIIYKEKKIRFNEDIEKQKQDNLAIKLKILEDLKQLG